MSTSSSDYDCGLYNGHIQPFTHMQPLYPGLEHPLVYYAQVERKQRNQAYEKIKDNCFVKAFRWYTQEHVPLSKTESVTNKQELKGFATWLDEKYEEYLRSNQLMKQNDVQINDPVDKSSRQKLVKRKKKFKSPWRRRQKCLNKQNGDAILKTDKSIEIILKPKNLSLSTSECCPKCNRSNTTITIDINTPSTLKSKSESILYILNEKEIYVVPSDEKRKLDEMIQIVDEVSLKKGRTKTKKSPQNDTSCQCSDLLIKKVNASSQFSHTNVKPSLCGCVETQISDRQIISVAKCPCTESNTKLKTIAKEEPKMFPQKVDSNTVFKKSVAVPDTNTNVEPRKTSFSTKTNIEKKEPPFTVGKIAQTSDHAINLDEAIHQGCPIFLKIVCTDKLR
ncbi:uncharacterized protein LOC116769698 isoform X2 [Danaus plexippus]|uniref:uncharacterized protein LOC116769698 isoform X2 n=1 Tax=Danaus plexippus TaxID=13037 RepID=UPI002AAFEFAF|nr:uncharacterized protein LOC116769698 isoform X2 [Danaus plexippus]